MSHAKTRLAAAREHLVGLHKKLAIIGEQQQQIRDNAQAAAEMIEQPGAQDQRDLFARLIRGKPDKAELKRMRDQIATHTACAAQLQQIEAAKDAAIEELNDEVRTLSPRLKIASQQVAEAVLESCREEIYQQIVPEFKAACETLRQAYAKLVGAGVAHCELAAMLQSNHGVAFQGAGTPYPNRTIDVPVQGFGIGDAAMPAIVRLDASALIDKHRAEFKESWK